MKNYLSLCVYALLFVAGDVARAQSLEAVLSSIQERKLAVEQRKVIAVEIKNEVNPAGDPDEDIPELEKISWTSGEDYPAEASLDAISMAARVGVLNQAAMEFGALKKEYINISPTYLDADQTEAKTKRGMGILEPYNNWDLPLLPRVTPTNYHTVLQELALRVEKLQVLAWPWKRTYSKGLVTMGISGGPPGVLYGEYGEVFKSGEDETFTLDPSSYVGDVPSPVFVDRTAADGVSIAGESRSGSSPYTPHYVILYDHNLTTNYSVTVTGSPGEGHLSGDAYVVTREEYTPAEGVLRNDALVAVDGAWTVEKKLPAGGDHAQGAEVFKITGDWKSGVIPPYESETTHIFAVNGYDFKSTTDDKRDLGKGLFFISPSNFSEEWADTDDNRVPVYFRRSMVLVRPTFLKGLDSTAMEASMDALHKQASAQGRGNTSFSAAGLKYALGLGGGAKSLSGILGVTQPYLQWWVSDGANLVTYQEKGGGIPEDIDDYSDTNYPHTTYGYSYGYSDSTADIAVESPAFRTHLRFLGAKDGFEVLYECRRDSTHRKELDEDGWDSSLLKTEKGWATFGHYIRAWDSPRLRQVVGRDMLADIDFTDASKSDYKYTIKLYWLKQGEALTYTADGYVSVTSLTLHSEFKISTPLDANGFPTDTQQLEIQEVGKYTYGGTLNDDGDITHLTLAVKEEDETLYEENWSRAENENGNVEVTLTTKHDGVTAATVKTTYPADTQPLSATPRPDKVEVDPGDDAVVTNFDYPAADTASWGTHWPQKISTTSPLEPDSSMEWEMNGLPKKSVNGNWTTDWTMDTGLLKAVSKYSGSVYARSWTEWNNGATQIKTYSAPDGAISSKSNSANSLVTIDFYGPTETAAGAFPMAVEKIENRDGTGSLITYTLAADGSLTALTKSGLISGSSISKGIKTEVKTNGRGYTLSVTTHDIDSNTQLSGTTFSDFSSWGAPKKSTDYLTGLDDTWTYDGVSSRIASSTNGLGVTTGGISYDALSRPTTYTWNGHAGSIDYNTGGLGVNSTLSIPDRPHSASSHWDTLGRPTSGDTTAGGAFNWNISRTASDTTLNTTNSTTGASHIAKTRSSDGGLESASGSSLPFNGLQGDALSIEGGLLKTTRKVTGLITAFETTLTDAWGRPRLVKKPSSSGLGTDDTAFSYSNPGDSIKRVTVDHPSGQRTITESQPYAAAGAITRNGLDIGIVTGDGTLGGGDRYTESITTLSNGKIVTTTTVLDDDGEHEILMVERNPATGVVGMDINDGDEIIARVPDYSSKGVSTVSTKGWMKIEMMNNLWQVDHSNTSGDGILTFIFDPIYRADGSLDSVSSNAGGAVSSAEVNAEGLLTSLVDPLLGNILGGHSFSNGAQTLTLKGTTRTNSLDGTASSVSGDDVVGQSRAVSANGSNIEETINPTTGASTKLISNAAGAQTTKDYAAGADASTSWLKGGLINFYSVARGGNVQFSYSNDGAKDLAGISYPSVGSDGFTGSSDYLSHAFGYSLAGLVNVIGDGSGDRTMAYEKFRLSETDWTSGYLNAYKVERSHDATGRLTGITLLKNGSVIHSITPAHTGASGEVASISSDAGFSAIYQRNAARNITGITRGSVTQSWGRGTAGRTLSAGSNVANAPVFKYENFDMLGRREDCTIGSNSPAGQITWQSPWQYLYGIAGQLVSARNTTLGNFAYNCDGIGRREDAGNPVNFANVLNQFKSISHAQQQKLIISAKPTARLWVNGNEMTPFDGGLTYNLTAPGPEGGWVPWHVEGILEGAGDPGAGPDAKAEFSGITYIPPAQESFTFDADGNRESSALWNYRWDGRNRLIEARTKDYATAPQGYHLTFDYDSEGRRFKKNIIEYKNGKVKKETHITFVYDGWDLLYELRTNALGTIELERKYVWGNDISGSHSGAGGAGGLLLIRETRGSITTDYYPLFDGSGHLTALADTSGNLVAEYAYGPFGELIHAKGPMAAANPWRYATKYYDEETGLYYFGHRYYDPVSGQWLNREPLGESESLNLYAYCHNDPVNKVDRLGLDEVDTQRTPTKGYRSVLTREIADVFYAMEKQGHGLGSIGFSNRSFLDQTITRMRMGTVELDGTGNPIGNITLRPALGGGGISYSGVEAAAKNNYLNYPDLWTAGGHLRKVLNQVVAGKYTPVNPPVEFVTGGVDFAMDSSAGIVNFFAIPFTGVDNPLIRNSMSAVRGHLWPGWDSQVNNLSAPYLNGQTTVERGEWALGAYQFTKLGVGISRNLRLRRLQREFDDLAENNLLPRYRALDPDLEAGYTGSFRTGRVGNPKKPTFGDRVDLDNFDIDYWIESDVLYEQFGKNLRADIEFRQLLREIEGFSGLKPNKKGFSILFKPTR